MSRKILLAAFAGLMGMAVEANAQTASISFNVPGPADWNVASNWTSEAGPFVPGDNFPAEVAAINNGGTAFLTAPALFPIDGLLLDNGMLDIRNNGSLTVVNGGGLAGGITRVGAAATLGIGGTGKLNTGSLQLNGTLARRLSSASNGVVETTGAANLAGPLSMQFNGGFVPTVGQNFKLVNAPAGQLNGQFTSVQASGLARGLALTPVYDTANGDASVTVDNRLVLSVDRRTGATSFENAIGPAITIDGYTITSASGQLSTTAWQSLDDKNTPAGWFEANPSANRISELNPTSSLAVAAGQSFTIGSPYAWEPAAFGEPEVRDLAFSYFSPDGQTEQGFVEYKGQHNNMVLLVDPATGDAALQNQSPFNVSIDFYTITSASGSLNPVGWSSLDDQNIGVWAEANPTDTRLSELYPVGGSAFTPGKGYEIGKAFDLAGTRDLSLRFTLSDGTSFDGIVEYGAFDISTGPVGDTNGDGKVNLDDLNNVRNNFGGAGIGDTDGDNDVDLDDLNNVRNNFGATGSASVPEPATWWLAMAGLPLVAWRLRRK